MKLHHHYKIAQMLAHLLDTQFSVLGFKFGFDPLLDFVPVAGDVFAALLSLYIVYIGHKAGVPRKHKIRMITNVVIDFLLGLIPVVGTIGDFIYKSNTKNLKIIDEHGNIHAVDGILVEKS